MSYFKMISPSLPFNLLFLLLDLVLQGCNHREVVERDVVVVVLDLVEGLVVAPLDVVYLVVLPLLHVAHLRLGP